MAEWWNKKYEFKLWSSLWLFLREVEGLDDTRARKYLEQLLENRYDTIDVLKLATKQDLVNDANILPGDALRIIAAAIALVARRDADRAEVFRQERKHGGEVRSEFPLTQETKASQETLAQGNGILPLPRHTIPQQVSGRHVRTRTGRIYYACGLCMITCPSEHWLRLHFNGKKHADRMEQGEDDGRRTAVRYAGTSASGQLVISPKAYHCSLCNITCTCKNDLINHFKGGDIKTLWRRIQMMKNPKLPLSMFLLSLLLVLGPLVSLSPLAHAHGSFKCRARLEDSPICL